MTRQYHCTGSSEKLRVKLRGRQYKWEGKKKTEGRNTVTFKMYSWIIRRAGYLISVVILRKRLPPQGRRKQI